MYIIGMASLMLAFLAIVVSVATLILAQVFISSAKTASKAEKADYLSTAGKLSLVGYIGVYTTAFALVFACALLMYCFVSGDMSLEYVIKYHTDTQSSLALLFEISGLWSGREGSLLLWAALIALFATVIAIRSIKDREGLDNVALVVMQAVIGSFVAILIFSDTNRPFTPSDPIYFTDSGVLRTYNELLVLAAQGYTEFSGETISPGIVTGLNPLLEHWAMAIHPPTLFVGYAGVTVPFAYAISALIVNDPSKKWVERVQRYTLFAWVFLGLGIGLGAVWAYVVLGWGGYWGWDAVENASLLSWIVTAALVHSLTVYRQRNAFKLWSAFTACLAFVFVILGTFITRSEIVTSVHAFQGDVVSQNLFTILIIVPLILSAALMIVRFKSFARASDDALGESLLTRGVMYFLNNVFLVIAAVVLAYLTLAPAFVWDIDLFGMQFQFALPFGGYEFKAPTFNAIARPMTIIYCFMMAVGPLLSWIKTDGKNFLRKSMIPGIASLIVFVLLTVYFLIVLMPSYNASVAASGVDAIRSAIWHFVITLSGFIVASLLFFNALFMMGRVIRSQARAKNINYLHAFFSAAYNRASSFGGFLTHLSIAVILVGLIGSSMYVTAKESYIQYDRTTGLMTEEFTINDYRLVHKGGEIYDLSANDTLETITFDVYKGDNYLGEITPGLHGVEVPQPQTMARAAVITGPVEDLFLVYNGETNDGWLLIAAYVNPLVIYVWIGFGIMILGTFVALIGRRGLKAKEIETATGAGGDFGGYDGFEIPGKSEAEATLKSEAEAKAEATAAGAGGATKAATAADAGGAAKGGGKTTDSSRAVGNGKTTGNGRAVGNGKAARDNESAAERASADRLAKARSKRK